MPLLTVETVTAFVTEALNASLSDASVEEIEGGNLNYAFRLRSAQLPSNCGSIFLKQSPDFIKCLGSDFKLTQDRAKIEVAALKKFNQLTQNSPKLIYSDESVFVMIMEDLHSHKLLRDVVGTGWCSNELAIATAVASFMVDLHCSTMKSNLDGSALAELQATFNNPAMCGLTHDYVFTKAFQQDPTNKWEEDLNDDVAGLHGDEQFCKRTNDIRLMFDTVKQALIHGDLHTGSIMVDQTGDTKVIDAEFAFYGPAGFDVALVIAGYIFTVICSHGEDDTSKQVALKSIEVVWMAYFDGLRAKGISTAETDTIASQAVAFCGCEIMRRIMGAAHWPPVDAISDQAKRIGVQRAALRIGKFCVMTEEASLPSLLANLSEILGASH